MIFPLLCKEGVRGRLLMTEYFNKSKYKQRRKYLRNNPTKAEELLWSVLKGRKLGGYKIRRQYGVGKYVIDFYCVEKKLAIEVDGEIHDNEGSREYDKIREEFINNFGIRIFRIRNKIIENNIDEAGIMILTELRKT